MWNLWGFRAGSHALTVAAVATLLGGAGCKKNKGGTTTPEQATDSTVAKVDETLCETGGKNVVTYDLNRDNRPDVWRLFKTEDQAGTRLDVLTCKQVDFDHDGRKDWVVGYGVKGAVLYERADFDYDGRFDMSSVYDVKTGKVLEVDRDSDFDGKYDLKEMYDTNGQLSSVRKDRDGNEEPDVWEQYKDGQLIAILYDDDGDSKVDRREEVPGSRPKVEMPEVIGGTASGSIDANTGAKTGTGTGTGAKTGTGTTGTGTTDTGTTGTGTKPPATGGTKPK